jgi:DNA-binding MarR family transcriptional regulator/GNAT superfamily N-acetyltransferase
MKNLSCEEINLLRHNARSVVRELGLLNDAYFEIGVTLAERHLLIELTSCTCPTMGEIAERLLLDKSTVSRLIDKAMKKGYVKCSSDKKDKRKRFLHLTELGKKTLNAFESIAFNQTEEALLTLTAKEIALVHQGVALYAKGLKNSRLQNRDSAAPEEITKKSNGSLLEIQNLLTRRGLTLKPFSQEDETFLYDIFRDVVDSGSQFPYECNSVQEFYRQFLAPTSHVYVCHSSTKEVVGGFYIRSNFSGRCSHIANAAYMIKSPYRGQGIGTLLVNASLEIAKDLGFQAMQFNMVLSQNVIATNLYQKLGFNIIGTIPQAIRNPDGSYQEGYILYRKLTV